jgi:hypothetical protein
MLTSLVVLLLAAILIVLLVDGHLFNGRSTNSTLTGSGVAATQTRSLAPFTSVELAGNNNVTVQIGRKQSVVVHADNNLLPVVTTSVRSGTLVIGNNAGSFAAKSPMSVEVNVPLLKRFTLSGSGNVDVTAINTPTMTVTLTGSGNLSASGTTTRLEVTVDGSGNAELQKLIAGDAHAVVSGSGTIWLTATNSLDASIPGSGAIFYGGKPAHVTTTITGSGTITPG